MGPLGGPVYNPVVSSLVLTGPSWQAGTRTNLCFQSEADPGWTAAGTTPPTINSNNTQVDGLTCTSTTFPILASGGYAVCRVNGTGNNAMMVAGAAYTPSSYLKLSRALTGTESIAIYVTGQAASHPITINAANSAGFLSWTRAIESSTFTPGTSGVGYFVIYANILNAPLTVYSSKRQVDMGPATAYIGPTFAAILSAYATVATSLSAAPRVNSCAYSENYNAWTGTGSTITNNAALGPDGLMTAGKLVYGGGGVANGQRAVTSNAATQGILAAGIMECSSLWLRADAPLTLRIYNNQGAAALTVNVTTAWQRFYISSLTDGVHYVQLSIYNSTPVDNSPFTVFLAKGQIEPGATPSSYIGPVIQTSVSVTDYAVAGSSVNLAKAPGKGATLAWTGTYQTGPWRVMSLGQDYIAGKAEATLVGAP